jgi:predicted nucleic acid-binding protein
MPESLADRLPHGECVALDAMSFIYFFERHPRHHGSSVTWFRRIAAGEATAVVSTLVLTEVLVPYFTAGRAERAVALGREIRTYPNLRVAGVDEALATNAARLRAVYNLRTPDAIHVATALQHGARWFVTNDRQLKRVEPEGLRIWLYDEQPEAPAE